MGKPIFAAGYQTIHVQLYRVTSAAQPTTEKAFEQLYKTLFRGLHAYAFTILKNEQSAEEAVQQVFYKIWNKKEQLDFQAPLKAYLYRAVHNESLNYLKHRKIKVASEAHIAFHTKQETEPADKKMMHTEMEGRLRKALNELPAQCRLMFVITAMDAARRPSLRRCGVASQAA